MKKTVIILERTMTVLSVPLTLSKDIEIVDHSSLAWFPVNSLVASTL